jgi:hypothetical protein
MPARPTAPPSRLGAELLLDALYRVLGVLVGWRRVLLVGGALGGFALWLALVYQAAGTDDPAAWLPAVLFPALLLFAGRRLVDLPPGVVFRPAPAAAGAPEPGCFSPRGGLSGGCWRVAVSTGCPTARRASSRRRRWATERLPSGRFRRATRSAHRLCRWPPSGC